MDSKYNKPLITCQFYGQLGNQLFILSAALAYAWDYGATPIFPGLHTQRNRTSYNKDRIFFRLDASNPPRQFKHIFREKEWYSSERIPFKEDLIIDGYFQSWKHFHHHRDKILQIFAPSDFTKNVIESKYGEILKRPNTVGFHVRTAGINVHNTNQQHFLGFEYYENAMNFFPEDSTFVIVADRINWVRKKFTERFKKNFVFAEGNYGIEDMFLMASCKHNIIANSTFSWWGAYFNQNADRKVIVPNEWSSAVPHPNVRGDLYLPDWTPIPYVVHPYPADMYAFDASSQSVDLVSWN
ncbi:MAG: alpha-1,2-fucosyltransferase [Verrucomicrobia bacterium]|nr:alpha-1,2-fucosyltransferase [Verrucomicrobiota bacterium]